MSARNKLRIIAPLVLVVMIGAAAFAQQVTIPTTGFAGLDKYRASRIAVYTDDYGQLARYRDANAALKPPAPGENRVVFFGDSITEICPIADSFLGEQYYQLDIRRATSSPII